MLQVSGDGTLFKRMSKLASLGYHREPVFSPCTKEKGKTQVHFIEPMNERRKKVLMGLERSFKIPEDAIDVMAQTKRPVEDTSHPNTSVKRFKEMARAPKEKKKNRSWRFGFQDFSIPRNFGPYLVVKDVESQKAVITIGQLVTMVPSV
jgi:hypothetical protein